MKLNRSRMSWIAGIVFLLGAQTASAADKLVPLHTRSDLRGTLKFYPADGGHPFKCKVRFVLDTGKGSAGHANGKQPEIRSATGLDCPQFFFFESLPWNTEPVDDGVTADVFSFGWAEQGGPSCNELQQFSVDKNGVWTATTGCVTGSLTSNPPITIKP